MKIYSSHLVFSWLKGIWRSATSMSLYLKYWLDIQGFVAIGKPKLQVYKASHCGSKRSKDHPMRSLYYCLFTPYTGWHKKTAITKNRITSKILFILTQNFSYIRSSLCSRHLQSFKSVLQKLFVSMALKKCAPNELSGTAGTFGSGRQSSPWPSRIPPLG